MTYTEQSSMLQETNYLAFHQKDDLNAQGRNNHVPTRTSLSALTRCVVNASFLKNCQRPPGHVLLDPPRAPINSLAGIHRDAWLGGLSRTLNGCPFPLFLGTESHFQSKLWPQEMQQISQALFHPKSPLCLCVLIMQIKETQFLKDTKKCQQFLKSQNQ